ncbi:MAG TPA: J domain-containing protein [Magnetovibrio sp.]
MASPTRKHGLETPFDFRSKSAKSKHARGCAWPGCADSGEFHAPKSPRDLAEHVWLCAEHIREHNKTWNYFDGMTDAEVEAAVRDDTVWQRPTWKLGSKPSVNTAKRFANARFRDDFGLFDDHGDHTPDTKQRTFAPGTPEAKAFATLDLDIPVTLEALKARYKQLVKRHHPDANAGAKAAEEKFKEIVSAYQVVLKHLEG